MAINSDLNTAPYFDDYNDRNQYYKILFKPSVAVQVRELNQLQTILQKQIERFGNNIFKRGTVIDGVNVIYLDSYPYVKLLDNEIDTGNIVNPSEFVGHFVRNPSSNLVAQVINYTDGFESTDPDLKTLYLKYLNSGNDGNTFTFTSGATLTVYDYLDSVHSVEVINGGRGFSNSAEVVFVSAIVTEITSNSAFSNTEYITAGSKRARVIGIDSNTIPGKTILNLRPDQADLTNASTSNTRWQFDTGVTIVGATSNTTATVYQTIGSGASGRIITDASPAKIVSLDVVTGGSGYTIAPFVTILAGNNTPDYTNLNLNAKNYIAQVTIASVANSVGEGYALQTSQGIIYQKGYFVRSNEQVVIVSKYNKYPDGISVGFKTNEYFIDSNIDPNLFDNVLNTTNELAPGADRLALVPELMVRATSSIADVDEFLTIVEFSEGRPYKETKRTQYGVINDEMALRTKETSGNFVLDRFLVQTRSAFDQADEGKYFTIVSDPGKAYIEGYRVETLANFNVKTEKGIDYIAGNTTTTQVNYGNYLLINDLGGTFQFNTGDLVDLYDTEKNYVNSTNINNGNTNPTGTKIGTARLRSLVYDSGKIGTPTAAYRLHIFDVRMEAGKDFRSVRSVYYNGTTNKGIADVVLENNATLNANIASINASNNNCLLFYTGTDSTRNISNVSFTYRTLNQTQALANVGTIAYTLSATEETFPYVDGTLTDLQKNDIILVPVGNNYVITPYFTGSLSVSTGSNTVANGVAGTTFLSDVDVGDYIAVFSNSTAYDIRRITAIANNTSFSIDAVPSFTNTTANFTRVLPKNIPVPLGSINTAVITISSSSKTMTIDLGLLADSSVSINAVASFDVRVTSSNTVPKVAARELVVKLDCSNNAGGTTGPWCLGVPDIFRLRKVYIANTSSVNTNSTDVTDQFYIDHNQNENYLDLGFLMRDPRASANVANTSHMLVVFDAFTVSNTGAMAIGSYVTSNVTQRFINDALPLANLTTIVNTWEIPELYGTSGKSYDLINYLDFRPRVTATANVTANTLQVTTNPAYTVGFGNTADPLNDRKFPLNETSINFYRDEFVGRKDIIIVTSDNDINVVRGVAATPGQLTEPEVPQKSLILNKLEIPGYPNLPRAYSANTYAILNKRIINEKLLTDRINNKTINLLIGDSGVEARQQRGYTMTDIGNLERRIRDLEYYVSLTLLEDEIKNKAIPSSLSPSINRFKYGFFVDDFNAPTYADLQNPEYMAEVAEKKCTPRTEAILLNPGSTDFYMPDRFTEHAIVVQLSATEPVPAPPPPPVVDPPTTTPNTTPNTTSNTVSNTLPTSVRTIAYRKEANTSQLGSSKNRYNDDLTINMASRAGEVTIYFYIYSAPDNIQVYKNGSVITSTQNAVSINSNDAIKMISSNWFNGKDREINTNISNLQYKAGTSANDEFGVINAGKIVFNHNPSDGKEYTIRTRKGNGSYIWRYMIDYPIDSTADTQPTQPSTYTKTTIYRATSISTLNYASYTDMNCGFDRLGDVKYVSSRVVLDIRGMKPLTNHKLYVNGQEYSNWAFPLFDNDMHSNELKYCLGEKLPSDKNGRMRVGIIITDELRSLFNLVYSNTGVRGNYSTNNSGTIDSQVCEIRDAANTSICKFKLQFTMNRNNHDNYHNDNGYKYYSNDGIYDFSNVVLVS